MANPTTQLKMAMGFLWLQIALCSLEIAGGIVTGNRNDPVYSMAFGFGGCAVLILINLMAVSKSLRGSSSTPQSEEPDSVDDSTATQDSE